jgi:hypothetical protein
MLQKASFFTSYFIVYWILDFVSFKSSLLFFVSLWSLAMELRATPVADLRLSDIFSLDPDPQCGSATKTFFAAHKIT